MILPPLLLQILLYIVGYLFGSIPFGLLVTRMAGMGDIRKIGSGNIGATNVLRTGNKALAAATLLLDGGKGAVAVLAGLLLAPTLGLPADTAFFMGFAAVVGHIYPIWLKFKGGKGVATTLGFVLATYWPAGLGMILTWVIVAYGFRISSLAAIVTVIACPIYAWFMERDDLVLPLIALAALVFFKHRENMQRIFKGTEPKIGKRA